MLTQMHLISTFQVLEEAAGSKRDGEKVGLFSVVFQIFLVLPPPPLKWRQGSHLSKEWDIFHSCLICHIWGQQRFTPWLLGALVARRVVSHLPEIGSRRVSWEKIQTIGGSRLDVPASLGRAGHLLQRMLHLGKECRPCHAVKCARVKGTGLIARGWSPLYPHEIGSKGCR